MPQATFHFPRGFLWGTATAAHQVEGNNTNNTWYAWEQAGHTAAPSGLACDWWGGRWREDLDRAAESGQNAHRFSVEWSRIQPEPERWDEAALDHYRQMLQGMYERGLTPLVTLHHFSDPLWFAEQGGWENEGAIKRFVRFAEKVVEALKEYTTLWCTFNEPNVYATMGYVAGDFPPGRAGDFGAAQRVMLNMVRAHVAAYEAIHRIHPVARVGLVLNYRGFAPARGWMPFDAWIARLQSRLYNDLIPATLRDGVFRGLGRRVRLPEARGKQDYLGINYYTRDLVAFVPWKPADLFSRRFYPPEAPLSETGFIAHQPEGMFEALKWGLQFNVPLIVTENGVEDSRDTLRPRYLAEHIHQVWRAVNFNWPVKGYFHWTLVDNFEWERGWTQRFGLWALDTETQARRKRPSADLYAAICRENGISYAMVAQYAPDALPALFP
ncbi:MAG TPA: glycoside hydrolase family 1 protein [Chloroflexi bacterium]|nr:glycoside hydrolase family 1 protein [Chloroflexota bacterium]